MSDKTEEAVIDTAPEADAPAPDETKARDFEAEAKSQGWVEEDKYAGKHPWVDAETFVKRGEELAPFLQASNKDLKKALEKAEKQIADLTRTTKTFAEHYSKVEQRAMAKAKAELEGKLDEAAEAGDVAGVRAVTREIADLEKEASQKPEPEKEAEQSKGDKSPELTAWLGENPWFDTDRAMTIVATDYSDELGRRGIPIEKQWAMITAHVKAEFPHKFENQRRNAAPAVEGEGSSRGSRGKSYSDLPPDARAQCDRFVKQGVLTREAYLKDYAW